jgi:hypothetical protein
MDDYAAYKEEMKNNGCKTKSPRKGNNRPIEYKDLDNKSKKKMRETVLAMSSNSSSTASTSTITTSVVSPPTMPPGPVIFMISVPVFNIAPPARRILPVLIQAAFPHITLQLESALECVNCPVICCIVDTATALTTGNLHFFAEIAKAYPHTVASIHSSTDYSPITLSGFVQQGGSSVTTNLTVGFQFHLPYLTREGTPTSFVITGGRDVTVNVILGLPFITQTNMVIDTLDCVAKLCAFDLPPFPIDFCHTMCAAPIIGKERVAANAALHADTIKEIDVVVAMSP